jgi:hypothetical protein
MNSSKRVDTVINLHFSFCIIPLHSLSIITTKKYNMDIEDDDWLHDSSAPYQGGAADPLTNVEYDRLASKYSDVRPPLLAQLTV